MWVVGRACGVHVWVHGMGALMRRPPALLERGCCLCCAQVFFNSWWLRVLGVLRPPGLGFPVVLCAVLWLVCGVGRCGVGGAACSLDAADYGSSRVQG